jgi:hypothetical protein
LAGPAERYLTEHATVRERVMSRSRARHPLAHTRGSVFDRRSTLQRQSLSGLPGRELPEFKENNGMLRRRWTLLVFTLIAFVPAGRRHAEAAASATPDNIRLTWSGDPKTTQTIGWRTDESVKGGKVEYAKTGQPFLTATAPPPEILETNVGTIKLFTVELRGLEPGTRYRYRVGDGTNWSAYHSFETEKEDTDEFQFLVFGDSHEKKPVYKVWQETANRAYRDNPSAKFMMSVGDLIYSGKDYVQWEAWFEACKDVIAAIPDMPAIGDHEPRGVTSKDEWQRPEYFVKLFRVPQNGPAGFKGEVYSFDYGPVHFVVLNSSFTYEFAAASEREAMIRAETAWLDADLASTRKRWKIVVYHDATYNIAPDRSGTLTKISFGPIIDKHHVDVVFNGHDHAVARSYFIRNGDFVTSASEGTVYYVSGRTGDNAKDSLGRKIWHPFFYDPQAQSAFLAVQVSRDQMTVKTRLSDGTLVDVFSINKAKPEESTPAVPFGAYQSPRLAVFGYLLPFGKAPEQNAYGEWFVDVNALAAFMSGRFNPQTNVLSYDGDEIKLQLADGMFLDTTKEMISLSGLRSVGFYGRYHKAMNMVMVERWRD